MLIEIGIEVLDYLALFMGPGVGIGICIGCAEGLGMGGLSYWQYFLQLRTPTRKIASAIWIMMASEMKVH